MTCVVSTVYVGFNLPAFGRQDKGFTLTWLKTLTSIRKAHLYNFGDKLLYEYIQNLILQSQIIFVGVFKQKLCMGQTCSCSTFRAKRKMRSFAWPVLQTCCKKSSWLFVSGRIRSFSVPGTQIAKPLKDATAKFVRYFLWCSDSSGGENVRKKNPQ